MKLSRVFFLEEVYRECFKIVRYRSLVRALLRASWSSISCLSENLGRSRQRLPRLQKVVKAAVEEHVRESRFCTVSITIVQEVALPRETRCVMKTRRLRKTQPMPPSAFSRFLSS